MRTLVRVTLLLLITLDVFCRPPRYMGEGFVVMQSGAVDIYYYQDSPGILTFLIEHTHS